MKKRIKKAFTLVELLVVIAILAVLSTVTVIGYNSFTEKANKSVDEQLCTQYNTILQAESVSDDDITLPELIIMIEENGIRANQFETKSKSYFFAYDRANARTVLLDKVTGNIEFPKNYDKTSAELWTVLGNDLKLEKGISNYALLNTMVLDAGKRINLNGSSVSSIKIDLNNSALKLASQDNLSGLNVTVENGTLVKSVAGINVTAGANAKIIDASADGDWGKVFAAGSTESVNDFYVTDTNAKTKTIKDKYFASETKKYFSLSGGNNVETIIVENCVFENIYVTTSAPNAKVIIKNCKFINVGDKNTAVITLQRNYDKDSSSYLTLADFTKRLDKFNYEITGNEFINCYRGINTTLPAQGKTAVIANNKFSMINVTSTNDYVKSFCVQLGSGLKKDSTNNTDHLAQEINTNPESGFGKLEIKDNEVISARALIFAHSGLSKYYSSTSVNFEIVIEALLTVKNNDTSNALEGLVVADPDKVEDLVTDERINNMDAIVAKISA